MFDGAFVIYLFTCIKYYIKSLVLLRTKMELQGGLDQFDRGKSTQKSCWPHYDKNVKWNEFLLESPVDGKYFPNLDGVYQHQV